MSNVIVNPIYYSDFTDKDILRFCKHIITLNWENDFNICWEMDYCKDRYGYYKSFGLKGIKYQCHRVAMCLYLKKDILGSDFVLHSCHNRGCVNPYHLHFGTNADNMLEMRLANRSCNGDKSKNSKLTSKLIFEILTRINNFEFSSLNDIEIEYNNIVNSQDILMILNGKIWNHVTKSFCQEHDISLSELKEKCIKWQSLSIELVKLIKIDLQIYTVSEVANKYCLNYEMVRRIKTGQTFKNIIP